MIHGTSVFPFDDHGPNGRPVQNKRDRDIQSENNEEILERRKKVLALSEQIMSDKRSRPGHQIIERADQLEIEIVKNREISKYGPPGIPADRGFLAATMTVSANQFAAAI